jgi:WD40 repeat protein
MRVFQTANGEVTALAFSGRGDALAVAVRYHGVYLCDLSADGPPERVSPECSYNTRGLFFSADGAWLAWLSGVTPKAYSRAGRRTIDAPPDAGRVTDLTVSPDGSRLLTLHSFHKTAMTCWAGGGAEWERAWSVPEEKLLIHTAAACPTGAHVAVLVRDTQPGRFWDRPIRVELRSAETGAVVASGRYPYGYRGPLLFSPDGAQLVGSNDMTLMAWPVPGLAAEPRKVRNDSRKHFTGLAYHPDGRHLFATSNDTTVHVFDTHTWDRTGRFTWNLGRLRSVAVSPDGALAAAGGDRGEVVVWDVDV